MEDFRKTSQPLLPQQAGYREPGEYNLYPTHPLGEDRIHRGYEALAETIAKHRRVILEGYGGVFWERLREQIDQQLQTLGKSVMWIPVDSALRYLAAIEALVKPFLGGDDPIFGTRFTGELHDFYDEAKLQALRPDASADVSILYGCGAALAGWDGFLVYVDVPKNEIQYRSRAGTITNLGMAEPLPPKPMYKRFYFVDWIALNKHKARLLPEIDCVVDAQNPLSPAFMSGEDLRAGLETLSRTFFRVRPWFEPGPWGGQWLKRRIPGLAQDVPNYAWSFEMIAPEQGIIFEGDGNLLEVSFDFLMYHDHRAVLGDYADAFGYEFPIRFDFLDTMDGGNLSVQCHPRPEFIRQRFGELFTQDETYYILDCQPGAVVYLGFQEDIDPVAFRAELESSFQNATAIDIPQYVMTIPANQHDLFLIPNGTIHFSGAGNMVLEISATPYIFTFKLYDWLRLDLEGKPRPLNIERALENLYFGRKGDAAREELVAKPVVLHEENGKRLVHLPTHPVHFYDIHRFDFESEMIAETNGSVHMLMLVEGRSITVEVGAHRQRFNYAETIVIPAAAGRYRLVNEGETEVKVIRAFLKPDWFTREENQWLKASQ